MNYGKLGIITNNQYGVFQRNVVAGVREVAEQRGYDLLIDSFAEDAAHPRPITLDYTAVAGVCVLADAAPVDLLHAMFAAGTPLSLVSHQVPELPIPVVMTDNAEGIAELMRHLVKDCGRTNLVFISGLRGQWDADERESAFVRELMRYNLTVPPEHFIRGDFSPDIAADSLAHLLRVGARFDAVIAADYLMGIAAVDTLRAAGHTVPDDVSVVGFGDAPESEMMGLTTVAADVVERGRRAARQVFSQIDGLRIRGVTVLSVRLVVRDTSLIPARPNEDRERV